MKKLKLDVDRIEVVSFSPETGARSRGTVNGFDSFVSDDCIPDGVSVIVCDGGTLDVCHTIGYQTCPREVNSGQYPC